MRQEFLGKPNSVERGNKFGGNNGLNKNNGGIREHMVSVAGVNNVLTDVLEGRFIRQGLKLGVLTENNIPKVLTKEQVQKAKALRGGKKKFVDKVNLDSKGPLEDIVGLYRRIDKETRGNDPRKRAKERLRQLNQGTNYITMDNNLTRMPEKQISILIPGNEPANLLLDPKRTNFEEVFVATTEIALATNESLVEEAGKQIPLRKEVKAFVEEVENIGNSITVIGNNSRPRCLVKKVIGQAGDYPRVKSHGVSVDDVTEAEIGSVIKNVVSGDIKKGRASVFIGGGENDIEIVTNHGEIFSSVLALRKSKLEEVLSENNILHGVVKKSGDPIKPFETEWSGKNILSQRNPQRRVA